MSARVLLVDDDDGARMTLAALLEDEGYFVVEATSCGSARAVVAEGQRFDLAILDEHLGDGLGSELARDVRASAPKVIIVSGSADELPKGGDAAFVKGGAFVDLSKALRLLLDR